jgi:hypothetical protein
MRRKNDRLAAITPRQIILGAAIWSLLAACATLAVLWMMKSDNSAPKSDDAAAPPRESTVAQASPPDAAPPAAGLDSVSPVQQPDEVTPTPTAAAPPHFTENIIVPGLTETGEQIMRDDAQHGRSPEGA